MNTLTLQIPDSVHLDNSDTLKFLASKLYESGRLSLGEAAELTNLSKSAFSEILIDYGVSFINYSLEDVIKDAANI